MNANLSTSGENNEHNGTSASQQSLIEEESTRSESSTAPSKPLNVQDSFHSNLAASPFKSKEDFEMNNNVVSNNNSSNPNTQRLWQSLQSLWNISYRNRIRIFTFLILITVIFLRFYNFKVYSSYSVKPLGRMPGVSKVRPILDKPPRNSIRSNKLPEEQPFPATNEEIAELEMETE